MGNQARGLPKHGSRARAASQGDWGWHSSYRSDLEEQDFLIFKRSAWREGCGREPLHVFRFVQNQLTVQPYEKLTDA